MSRGDEMSSKYLLRTACVVLVIHGVIELLAVSSLLTGESPNFVFQEVRENWQQAIYIGVITGAIRIVASVGIYRMMKWGVVLGIAISAITFSMLTFYLPFGVMDSLLAGIVLVLSVMAYFGKEKIA